MINDKGQTVQGSGLWKVSMWGSGNVNGSGDRISYEEQVIIISWKTYNDYDFSDWTKLAYN